MSNMTAEQRFEKRFRGTIDFTSEDGGQALVSENLEGDGEDSGMFVRVYSWDEKCEHVDASLLADKEVEVIVREVREPANHQTGRGFTHMEPQRCTRNSEVKVYESSAADGPHIWLNVQTDVTVFTEQKPGEGTAHLSLEQAELLRDQLDWLIQNHYQVR